VDLVKQSRRFSPRRPGRPGWVSALVRALVPALVTVLFAVLVAACGAPAHRRRPPHWPHPHRAPRRPGGTRPGGSAGRSPPPAPTQLNIWLTGYSWQDNTPPGSSVVGEPVLHQQAGGTGTFADPITVAVPGHQGAMAWQPGTRFYLPTVRRYVIVEDSGASRPPAGADTHLDMWIGGQDGTLAATNACEDTLTGRVPACSTRRRTCR